jgi:tryptophan-rich sensory protein
MSRNIVALILFVGLCLVVEVVSGLATRQSVSTWYVALNKPSWTPPGWLFGPVWTILYISMGVAAWLVWKERAVATVTPALVLFFVQLALNALWSLFFFGQRQIGMGLVDIGLLWLAVAATIVAFWMVRPLAGGLLIPYLVWVSFATALNYSIWRLN